MSRIIELADAYAVTGPLFATQREARAALVAEVEKLEKDAAMLARVIVMHPDDPAIKQLDGVLVYVQRTLPKMEATNGQGT